MALLKDNLEKLDSEELMPMTFSDRLQTFGVDGFIKRKLIFHFEHYKF